MGDLKNDYKKLFANNLWSQNNLDLRSIKKHEY